MTHAPALADGASSLFPPTRAAGHQRAVEAVPRLGAAYGRDRNHDRGLGNENTVSALSPYVRHRLITERELVAAVIARHGARAHDVGRIVTAYAPTGYAADALDRARADAAGDGIVIETVLRGWDARAWPHATRGFFPFTERIPGLVRDAGIGA